MPRSTPLVLGAAGLLALASTQARAHEVGLSRGVYTVDGAALTAELIFARGELRTLVPGLDVDGDGALTDAELAAGRSLLQSGVVDRVVVRAEEPCPGALEQARLVEEDGATVTARYTCPAPPRRLSLALELIAGTRPGHRHLAQVVRAGAGPEDSLADLVLRRGQPRLALELAPGAAPSTAPAGAYFVLGVEHILIGIDHLAFLLGLVVVGGRWRSLLAVVTAFTLGHSLSLALATLQIWTPSGAWIEPAIAASIAYVGAENFFVRDAAGRWRVTLPFGFVHGFGFAGALGEVGVPPDAVGLALLLFNLGVEAGQLAVLAALLPALAWLHRQAWFGRRATLAISAAVGLAGVAWLFERL